MTGLAVILAASLIMILYVYHEYSYDRFNKKSNRIYRITEIMRSGNTQQNLAMCPIPLGPILKNNVPDIEQVARLTPVGSSYKHILVSSKYESGYESHFYFADPSIFQIFSIHVVDGNPVKGLSKPNTVFISRTVAKKYFGNRNPVGDQITLNNRSKYKVTGVFKDLPSNSSLQFNFLISYKSLSYGTRIDWSHRSYTYLLLKSNQNFQQVQEQIRKISKPYLRKRIVDVTSTVSLMPLLKIHLYSGNLIMKMDQQGELRYVYFFTIMIFLLLIIGSVNYIFLSTAPSYKKASEYDSINQHFVKDILKTGSKYLISLIAGIILTILVLSSYNHLFNNQISLSTLYNPSIITIIFLLWILLSVISGSIIAIIQSFQRLALDHNRKPKGILRKLFIIFLSGTSTALIISAFVIHRQLKFAENNYMGSGKNTIILIPTHDAIGSSYPDFKSMLLNNSSIHQVTTTSYSPGFGGMSVGLTPRDIQQGQISRPLMASLFPCDNSFIKAFNLKIIDGHDFSQDSTMGDGKYVLVNQAAVKKFGWKSPVGKNIRMFGVERKVIGVVKDFYYSSLKDSISPAIVLSVDKPSYYVFVQMDSKNIPSTISYIKKVWNGFANNTPFEYTYLKRDFKSLYNYDQVLNVVFYTFAFLISLAALISLLSLSIFHYDYNYDYSDENPSIKASTLKSKFLSLSKFTGIGFLIGIPFGWFIADQWLQNFIYRIHFSLVPFLIAGIVEFLIILLGEILDVISYRKQSGQRKV